jgi:hypothetical protein
VGIPGLNKPNECPICKWVAPDFGKLRDHFGVHVTSGEAPQQRKRKPRIYIGVPAARVISASVLITLEKWAAPKWPGALPYEALVRHEAVPGRIDIARSILFHDAKKMDSDVHIQVDADCEILDCPLWLTLLHITTAQDMGFDFGIWPTFDATGTTVQINGDPKLINSIRPWPIEGARFGGEWFSRKILRLFKPIGEITGTTEEERYLLYMENNAKEGEDFNCCRRLREQGFKICADPRVRIGHRKEITKIASYPAPAKPAPAPTRSVDARSPSERPSSSPSAPERSPPHASPLPESSSRDEGTVA